MREDPLRPQLRQIVAISGSLQKCYFRVGDTSSRLHYCRFSAIWTKAWTFWFLTENRTKGTFVEAAVLHFSAPLLINNMHQILTTDLPHYAHFSLPQCKMSLQIKWNYSHFFSEAFSHMIHCHFIPDIAASSRNYRHDYRWPAQFNYFSSTNVIQSGFCFFVRLALCSYVQISDKLKRSPGDGRLWRTSVIIFWRFID